MDAKTNTRSRDKINIIAISLVGLGGLLNMYSPSTKLDLFFIVPGIVLLLYSTFLKYRRKSTPESE